MTLGPMDSEKLRAVFANTHGPVSLCKDVTCVRVLFKYAYDADLIERPVKFGPAFRKPSRSVLRRERHKKGKRLFSAVEIRCMLGAAGPQLRAMILLGINCGFGNNDCAMLSIEDLDLDRAFIEFPRPKTGIRRRCPLWPKTVEALTSVLQQRPRAKQNKDAQRVFITKYGFGWQPKSTRDNPIAKEMAKLLAGLGLQQCGRGFYALRHTFQTIGEKSRDKDAVRAIMGHTEEANDMSAVYNEEPVEDARLQAVTEYVRHWLFSKTR